MDGSATILLRSKVSRGECQGASKDIIEKPHSKCREFVNERLNELRITLVITVFYSIILHHDYLAFCTIVHRNYMYLINKGSEL